MSAVGDATSLAVTRHSHRGQVPGLPTQTNGPGYGMNLNIPELSDIDFKHRPNIHSTGDREETNAEVVKQASIYFDRSAEATYTRTGLGQLIFSEKCARTFLNKATMEHFLQINPHGWSALNYISQHEKRMRDAYCSERNGLGQLDSYNFRCDYVLFGGQKTEPTKLSKQYAEAVFNFVIAKRFRMYNVFLAQGREVSEGMDVWAVWQAFPYTSPADEIRQALVRPQYATALTNASATPANVAVGALSASAKNALAAVASSPSSGKQEYYWKIVPVALDKGVEPPVHMYITPNFIGHKTKIGSVTNVYPNDRDIRENVSNAQRAIAPDALDDTYKHCLTKLPAIEVMLRL